MINARRVVATLAEHPDIAATEVVTVWVDGLERPLALVAVSGFVTGPELREFLWRESGEAAASIGLLILERIPRRDGTTDLEAVESLARHAGDEVWLHAPADELESELAVSWARVLELAGVSVVDTFLDLGGDSLAAIRVAAEVENRYAVTLALDELLDLSVRGLAVLVRERRPAPVGEAVG